MGQIFPANLNRYDPYKTYRFLVYFGTSTTPVAAVSKVGAIKRSSDVIEYKEGGNAIILKGLGRTKYEPITLERGNHPGHGLRTSGPTTPRFSTRVMRPRRSPTCARRSASSC